MMEHVVIPAAEYERQKKARFPAISTTELMALEFPPIRWTVPGYVAGGLSILAGRQKLGKTWLAIDWAIAVACGGVAMASISCEQGDVLYIDMENGQRRIQSRLKNLFPSDQQLPDLSRLSWVEEAPRLGSQFFDALDNWMTSAASPRLVVIDVFQRVKPAGKPGQNAYENDYEAMSPLQAWATQNDIAVVCLHHTRKGGADDPLEALSGSNGLSACADSTLVLDRDANGVTLYVRGRDVEERESALKFLSGRWFLIGGAAEVRRTDERTQILSALLTADGPISPGDIATATGMPRNNVDQLLFKMARDGEVLKSSRGRYSHPNRAGA
jgi:hypothetical protein